MLLLMISKNYANLCMTFLLVDPLLIRPRGYKTFFMLNSNMKFFLLINVKMPTIVGILTFINRKNSILSLFESEKSWISWYFYTYEHLKFHAQLSWAWKKFITAGPGPCSSSLSVDKALNPLIFRHVNFQNNYFLQIRPVIDEVLSLEELPRAFEKVGQKHGRGKTVIDMMK